MLRLGERAVSHLGRVARDRVADRRSELRVLLDEARRFAVIEAEQVVPDEHLAIATGPGADSDRRDRQRLGDAGRDGSRDGLEDNREAPRRLERKRVLVELNCLRRIPALRFEAAEHRRGLRRQADVTHHGNSRGRECANAGEHRAGTLELDRVGGRLLDEPDRRLERLRVRYVVRAEGEVGDHERPAGAAVHGAREDDHLVGRRRNCRVVAEHDHRGRVADQDQVDAGVVGDAPRRRVVRGHHHDAVAAALHLADLGQRELARRGCPGSGLAWAGGHGRSPFGRATLSISRVEPTRAATRSVGPSKSATST